MYLYEGTGKIFSEFFNNTCTHLYQPDTLPIRFPLRGDALHIRFDGRVVYFGEEGVHISQYFQLYWCPVPLGMIHAHDVCAR